MAYDERKNEERKSRENDNVFMERAIDSRKLEVKRRVNFPWYHAKRGEVGDLVEGGEVVGDHVHVIVLVLDLLHVVRNEVELQLVLGEVRPDLVALRIRLK